jgi:2-polyprenyl-3-methyl-5-hydroxy-6-metoxy-1,4-benzoquinol methylase
MVHTPHLQDYWDDNLDIQNLGADSDPDRIDIDEEIAFWMTPDQKFVYDQLGDLEGKTIVDLGGGLSVNCIILARKGARVIVVDLSINRLRILKRIVMRCGLENQVSFICSTAEEFALADETIDVVLTKSVLIHTRLPDTMRQISRCLKPGGQGFFTEPTTKNIFANIYRSLFAPKEWKKITHYFDESSIAVIENRFPDITMTPFYLIGFFAFFWQFGIRCRSLFKFSLKIVQGIDAFLFKMYTRHNRYAWFQVIQIKK